MIKNTGIEIDGIKIYEDKFMDDDKILIGRKGNNYGGIRTHIKTVNEEKYEREDQSELIKKIIEASNKINNFSKNVADFVITSSSVVEELNKLSEKERKKELRRILNKKLNKIKK